MLPARRALISVSDKSGLTDFAQGLADLGIEMISTGGTYRALEKSGVEVIRVADVTGFPEILDGRVKTLHPNVHGGILADRGRSSHLGELKEHGISPIDIAVVNLYPFQETVRSGASFEEVIEMIDIGGPTMLRASAKNFKSVLVIVDPADYPQVLTALEEGQGTVPDSLRQGLALKAFRHTQAYDAAIAHWLQAQTENPEETTYRRHLTVGLVREMSLRYGENPHQHAAVYREEGAEGLLGGFEQHQGKALSWNNLLDANAARRLVSLLEPTGVVIVKHNNPCGVGLGSSPTEAYERALACDPVSAFGSIVTVNTTVDLPFVEAMAALFVEVLVAPEYTSDALEALQAKKNLRVLTAPLHEPRAGAIELRAIAGGYLAQAPDDQAEDPSQWTCPTQRQPTEEELSALSFVWAVTRHVKSNAIVLANAHQTVGIGAGQMSRVDACKIAVDRAHLPVAGSVAGSDAFFPFRDGLETLAKAGVVGVVQPGGSKRDDEVIAAADEYGMTMLFTGQRHFKH